MLQQLPRKTLFVSMLVAAFASTSAHATDPGFCGKYARAALNQVRAALSMPQCRFGLEGSRWSGSFNVHFNWCRGATYAAARLERAARAEHIRACGERRVP